MSDIFNPVYQPKAQPPQPQPQQNYSEIMGPQPPPYSSVDGRPYRLPPREPFVPSREDRPYSQWVQPDFALQGALNYPGMYRGPLMPQMQDFAQLIHGAVMGLGRFGSHYTGMPAIAMGTYANAYWTAYQKGMHERAAQSYQQYRMARQMTIDRGKEEMSEYATIYAKYHDENGKITDPEAFHNELLQAAHKYQNRQIIGAIEGGHPEQADRILGATDAHIMNLIKATHQEERAKEQDRLRRLRIKKLEEGEELPPEWGGHGKPGNGSIEPDTKSDIDSDTEPDADSDTVEPDTEPDAESDTEPSPTRIAEIGAGDFDPAGTRPSRPASGQPSVQTAQAAPHIATPEEVNQRIDEYAHGALRGETIPKNIPKSIASRIEARRGDMERQLDDIISSGATGDDMLNKVRAFDPTTARTIQDIASGKRVVPSAGGFGAGSAPIWNRLTSLVSAYRPGWGPEVASFRREFMSANGAAQKTLKAASSMTGAAQEVLEALQYIGENDKPPANWIDQIISRNFTGTPQWNRLGAALNSYVEESTKLARGGQSAEGDINRVLQKYAPLGMGPKGIRSLLAVEAGVAASQVQAQVNQWKNVTGEKTPPLSFDPDSYQRLQVLQHIDMMTGQLRPGSPPPPDDLRPLLGPSGMRIGELSGAKEGDRKQFKQGWGVFRNGKWVPE